MTSIKEYAESSAETIKSLTSTQENVIVLKDTTSSMESAVNVDPSKPTMNTLKPASSLPAQESMSITLKPLKPVSAKLSTSELEEYVPTATLVNTMTSTLTDVYVNLDTNSNKVFVKLFVPLDQLTSMENVFVKMVSQLLMEAADLSESVLFTVATMPRPIAAFAMLATESSMVNVQVINIAVLMVTSNTDNATAIKDTTGF